MDFVGPLPQTTEGYRHILIVVDSTTLYVEAFPTKSSTAEEVSEILYKELSLGTGWWESFCPIKDRRLRISW